MHADSDLPSAETVAMRTLRGFSHGGGASEEEDALG
jgi:hypothetical protein